MTHTRIHPNLPAWLLAVAAALACSTVTSGEPPREDDIWRDGAGFHAQQPWEESGARLYQPATETPVPPPAQVSVGISQGGGAAGAARRVGWVDLSVVGLVLVANCTALIYVSVCLFRTDKRTRAIDEQLHRHMGETSSASKPETSRTPASGSGQDADGGFSYAGDSRDDRRGGQEALPRVVVAEAVLQEMVGGINGFRKGRPDVETGYALVGKVEGAGDERRMVVCGLIPAGEKARGSAGHVEFDRAFQQTELTALQVLDPQACHIGDAHLHPGCYDRCSAGDYQTDQGNVKALATKEMVFVIATVPYGRVFQSADSLYRDGLKLDFYYLGKSSGYEYRKVLPEVVAMPALKAGPLLRAYVQADPARARMDLGNLRRLTGFHMRVLEGPEAGAGEGRLCIELAHRSGRYKATLVVGADPEAAPSVVIEQGQGKDLMEFRPEFLDSRWVPQVWLTPIAVAVEKEMAAPNGAESQEAAEAIGRTRKPYEIAATGPDPRRAGLMVGPSPVV